MSFDLVQPLAQIAAPISDGGQLGGQLGEDVFGGGEQRSELLQRGGERAVRHRLQFGADRPTLRRRSRRHVSAAQKTRLHFSQHERHDFSSEINPTHIHT